MQCALGGANYNTMQIAHSVLDVRRASEQLTCEEIEEFARNISISELNVPTTPVVPTGVWKYCRISDRAISYRNVLGVSISLWFSCSATYAVIGLQSSLNVDQGLGLATLSVSTFVQMLISFASPVFLSILGSKYAIVTGYVALLLYTLSNYYPSWYTLTPGAVFLGFSFGAVTWTGVYNHIAVVAIKSSFILKEDPKYLVALFTGVLTFFIELSYIPGNLVASVVLFSNHQESTVAARGNSTCNNTEAANLDKIYVYIMLSVYVMFCIAAIVIVTVCVDDLHTERRFMSPGMFIKQHVNKPCIAVTKVLFDWKLLLLAPMIFLVGSLISLIVGIFPKEYISDCIGVRWVGLVLMTYGVCSGVSAFISGRLVKHVPQYLIIYAISVACLATLLFLVFWERAPIHSVLFVVAGSFGVCQGSLNSITSSFTAILFPNKQQTAFSANRFFYSSGLMSGFFLPLVVSLRVHLWLMVAQVVVSVITYSILILKTSSRDQLLPCLAHKSRTLTVKTEDG